MNNLEQAENELEVLLTESHGPDEIYEAKAMKANILVARKRPADAAVAWDDLLKEFPERARKDNVGLNLVVSYEELNDFGRAIEVLERMKADYGNPDFIRARIERLAHRRNPICRARRG